ncbi:hypothetical protein T265_14839, partial [Opisthorchis viverrini]
MTLSFFGAIRTPTNPPVMLHSDCKTMIMPDVSCVFDVVVIAAAVELPLTARAKVQNTACTPLSSSLSTCGAGTCPREPGEPRERFEMPNSVCQKTIDTALLLTASSAGPENYMSGRFAHSSATDINILLPVRHCLQLCPIYTYSGASVLTERQTNRGSNSELFGWRASVPPTTPT